MNEDPIETTADADADDATNTQDEAAELRAQGFDETEIAAYLDDSDLGDKDPKANITDEDEDEDDDDKSDDDANDDADDTGDEDGDDSDDDAGDDDAGDGSGRADGDDNAAAAAAAAAAPPIDRGTPDYGARARSEVTTDLKAVQDERRALRQKWRDGDIVDSDEYDDALDGLTSRELDLRAEQTKAELVEGNQRHRWDEASDAFYKANPIYADSKHRQRALKGEVDDMMGDDAWSRAAPSTIIAEAQRRVDADLGQARAPAAKVEDKGGTRSAVGKRGEARRAAAADPTLGGTPAAEIEGGDKRDSLTAIDDLEGEDYLNAMARVSDEDFERYAHN